MQWVPPPPPEPQDDDEVHTNEVEVDLDEEFASVLNTATEDEIVDLAGKGIDQIVGKFDQEERFHD